MSKKNPSSDLVKPDEIADLHQQQVVGNNPNVYNPYGSSTTTFDHNGQPTITQEFSPELQGLQQQQLAYLQGGPQQVTPYRNSGLDSLFQGFQDRMNARNGGNAQAQLSAPPQPQQSFTAPPQLISAQPTPQLPNPQQAQPTQGSGYRGGGGHGMGNYDAEYQRQMHNLNRLFSEGVK